MDVRIVPTLSALTLFATCLCAGAETFDDLWLTRIKPPPYGGVATEFDDRIAAHGKRLHPYLANPWSVRWQIRDRTAGFGRAAKST